MSKVLDLRDQRYNQSVPVLVRGGGEMGEKPAWPVREYSKGEGEGGGTTHPVEGGSR